MRKDVGLIIEFENGEITEKDKIETFNSIMDFFDRRDSERERQANNKKVKSVCMPAK